MRRDSERDRRSRFAGRRLFDLSLGELLMIGVLAIVFIGPDDLPKMMRLAGRYYAKIRRASDDLRRAFNAEVAKVEAEERREEMRRRREEMEKRRAELQAKLQEDSRDPTKAAEVVEAPLEEGARNPRHLPDPAMKLPELPPAEAPEPGALSDPADPRLLLPDPRLPEDAAPRLMPPENERGSS